MKICSNCLTAKDESEFSKSKSAKDGLVVICKKCASEKFKAWREANKEKRESYMEKWRETNKDHIAEYDKRRYEEDPERQRRFSRNWRAKNVEVARDKSKKWYAENKSLGIALTRDWQKRNPDKVITNVANRRALKRNSPGQHTAADRRKVVERQGSKCAVCSTCLKKKHHIDHVIPLSKGGSNDIRNLQALCPKCNMEKHDSDPVEFMQKRGFLI